MNLIITGRHIEVPDNLKEFLEKKIQKLERFGHNITSVHAILEHEKYLYSVELTLVAKGINAVGKSTGKKDLLTCVEEAVKKLRNQLTRHEAKLVQEPRRRVPHRPA